MKDTKILITSLIFSTLCSCTVHQVSHCQTPCVDVSENFSHEEGEEPLCSPWWEKFNDPSLNSIMKELLSSNFQLQQACNRLTQANKELCMTASALVPQITLGSDVATLSLNGGLGFGLPQGVGLELPFGKGFSIFSITELLSYEVDLWKKLDSNLRAACENVKATKQDLDATALTLSALATEIWLTIKQQKELTELLQKQVKISRTQLELVELRYSVGESDGLTVYQQRLQLASTEADVPPIKQLYETSINGLQVLLGNSPTAPLTLEIQPIEEMLPPKPALGTTWNLVQSRPDLRAAYHRMVQADYLVGVAVAERLPALNLNLATALSSFNFKKFFSGELYAAFAELSAPLIDGGRRKCEVQRRKALLWERANAFSDLFLNAIKEVENAIVQEEQQVELLKLLTLQEKAARSAFEESQWRYLTGQINYLDVITALQALQNVERRYIVEKKNLWSFRANLYQALGGGFEICDCI